jgi:hypothetical protein
MMSVQAPWVLWVSGAAVLGVVLAHLLSVGRPPELALPTTRFVPPGELEAVSRARALRDVLLLLLRVLAVLLAGAAFAGVRLAPPRAPVATMLVLDLPQHAMDTTGWRDTVRTHLADGERAVLGMVTSDGRVVVGEPAVLRAFADSVLLPQREMSRASLAAALLAARREAATLAVQADSVALVVISPLRIDATTPALFAARATWPGRVILVPVGAPAAAVDTTAAPTLLRTVYGTPLAADSTFAAAGGTLVVWPDSSRRAVTNDGDTARAFAVITQDRALVAPLRRVAAVPDGARPRAWFADGAVAIGETTRGDGCVRWVSFMEPSGDALLTGAARSLREVLDDACASRRMAALPESVRVVLEGDGALASRAALVTSDVETSSAAAKWLLLAALGVLLIEQLVRGRSRRGTS